MRITGRILQCILLLCASVVILNICSTDPLREEVSGGYQFFSNYESDTQEGHGLKPWNINMSSAESGKNNPETSKNDSKKLVYIKTVKTGSSTMTNILYRFALKHNLSVMTFYRESPQAIHQMNLLKKEHQPRFDMVMEHLTFNETYFDKIMPGNKQYISTLRYPMDQLVSQLHYKDTQGFAQPGAHLHRAKYQLDKVLMSPKDLNRYGQKHIKIPNQSEKELGKYFQGLGTKFLLILITEYYDASLVLLKRKLSWTLSDIVYSTLKKSKYTKDKKFTSDLLSKHQKLRPEEYSLYRYFNHTFWGSVGHESSDFWLEVEHYRRINKRISVFCEEYYRILQTDIKKVQSVIQTNVTLTIDNSNWNDQFTIDPLDCVLMKTHKMVFLIMNTVRNFPVLCKHRKEQTSKEKGIRVIDLYKNYATFDSQYCSPASTRYNIPVKVLADKDAFDWDDYFNVQPSKNK